MFLKGTFKNIEPKEHIFPDSGRCHPALGTWVAVGSTGGSLWWSLFTYFGAKESLPGHIGAFPHVSPSPSTRAFIAVVYMCDSLEGVSVERSKPIFHLAREFILSICLVFTPINHDHSRLQFNEISIFDPTSYDTQFRYSQNRIHSLYFSMEYFREKWLTIHLKKLRTPLA